MSNMIYILIKAKWKPVTFNCWIDPEGSTWATVNFRTPPDIVASAIIQSYLDIDLERAGNHYNGKGIQDGIDIENTLRLLRKIKCKQDNCDNKIKACLETVMSARSWPAARINQAYPEVPNKCLRCGLAPEDDLHVYWQCPANKNIDDPCVKDTQVLVKSAEAGCVNYPCFWLRGLVPKSFTLVPPEHQPVKDVDLQFINYESVDWHSDTYYGDASGGKYTQYNQLRRCGVGIAVVNDRGELIFGLHTPLPGNIQTVSRGELYAVLLVVKHTLSHSVHFITDNKGVYSVFHNGPIAAANSANCDLWALFFQCVSDKHINLSIRWMPSHLIDVDPSKWPSSVSNIDVKANDFADKFAGTAADSAQIANAIAVPHMIMVKRTCAIQKRLAAILSLLPPRKKIEISKPAAVPANIQPSVELLMQSTRHNIIVLGPRLRCRDCLSSFHTKDSSCKAWLQSPCVKPDDDREAPIRIRDVFHIGNQVSHHSHKLFSFKALIYCNICGSYARGNRLVNLSRQCSLRPTDAGRRVLESITAGVMPGSCVQWPLSELEG